MFRGILFEEDPLVGARLLVDFLAGWDTKGFKLQLWPCVQKITFVMFIQNVASDIEISNAELICLVNLQLIDTASMSWTSGTPIAFNGDSRAFDPVS